MTRNHKKSAASAFASPTIALAVLALVFLASLQPAKAQTFSPLHDFPEFDNTSTDGLTPEAGLVMDARGNLYGTTLMGGTHIEYEIPYYYPGPGTVFKVTPNGTESVLYSFGGSDGASPSSDLVIDSKGNLYGTTQEGGSMNMGTIFKVSKSGVETVLHNFTCSDGAYPVAGLVMDGNGDLYGTASEGGPGATSCPIETVTGNGVLFKLSASGVYAVLHDFVGGPSDISNPMGTLILKGRDLYGVGNGSIFKVTPNKNKKATQYTLSILYSGDVASGRLLMDSKGNIYGAAGYTVFKLEPSGRVLTLHTFLPYYDGTPNGGLVMDKAGNIYGTTVDGGLYEFGTLFMIDRNNKETVLNNFDDNYFPNGLYDGQHPNGNLIIDAKGNIYGTCRGYGDYATYGKIAQDWGTVFKFRL